MADEAPVVGGPVLTMLWGYEVTRQVIITVILGSCHPIISCPHPSQSPPALTLTFISLSPNAISDLRPSPLGISSLLCPCTCIHSPSLWRMQICSVRPKAVVIVFAKKTHRKYRSEFRSNFVAEGLTIDNPQLQRVTVWQIWLVASMAKS